MDFVTGLPISTDWKGTSYNSILVIVDRMTLWKDLSMDFVTGLPTSTDWKGTRSHDSILVIVDRLTKMVQVHYEPVQITINAPGLAEVILDFVPRNHGLPDSIVSDMLPAIKFTHDVFHVSLLKQDTTRKGWVCKNATRTLLCVTVSVLMLGMPGLRSTRSSGW